MHFKVFDEFLVCDNSLSSTSNSYSDNCTLWNTLEKLNFKDCSWSLWLVFGENSHFIHEESPVIIIQSFKGAMDSVAGLFFSTINANGEKMVKNQYNQIPHPAHTGKWHKHKR